MRSGYRSYYWKKTREQLSLCWTLFWNGVVCNKGHHSEWNKTWFFKHKK